MQKRPKTTTNNSTNYLYELKSDKTFIRVYWFYFLFKNM